MRKVLIYITIALLNGCTLITEPKTAIDYNSKTVLHDTINLIKANYPFILFKHINVDSIYSYYSSNISKYNGDEIYRLLYEILYGLKDAHIWFYNASGNRIQPYTDPRGVKDQYSFSLNIVEQYLKGNFKSIQGGKFVYGIINRKIGYIYIQTFNNDNSGWYKSFSNIINKMKTTQGMILDVRSNEGGSMSIANYILSFFIDKPFLSSIWLDANQNELPRFSIQPAQNYYSKPVILLQNGVSFSSAEGFICMMRELPNVTTLGDTTGGGGGSPKEFKISYNIIINLPTAALLTYQRKFVEWNGIEPDILLQQTKTELENGKDPQLEKAISILEK